MEFHKFRPLSNHDFNEHFKKNKKFGGVFPKDLFPDNIQKGKFYIINMDDSIGNGTHWVCICNKINKKNELVYFDSFGVVPPKQVLKTLKAKEEDVLFSNFQLQDVDSFYCGYYCIYVINEMLKKNRSILEIVFDFGHDKKKNDNKIVDYFIIHNIYI